MESNRLFLVYIFVTEGQARGPAILGWMIVWSFVFLLFWGALFGTPEFVGAHRSHCCLVGVGGTKTSSGFTTDLNCVSMGNELRPFTFVPGKE